MNKNQERAGCKPAPTKPTTQKPLGRLGVRSTFMSSQGGSRTAPTKSAVLLIHTKNLQAPARYHQCRGHHTRLLLHQNLWVNMREERGTNPNSAIAEFEMRLMLCVVKRYGAPKILYRILGKPPQLLNCQRSGSTARRSLSAATCLLG